MSADTNPGGGQHEQSAIRLVKCLEIARGLEEWYLKAPEELLSSTPIDIEATENKRLGDYIRDVSFVHRGVGLIPARTFNEATFLAFQYFHQVSDEIDQQPLRVVSDDEIQEDARTGGGQQMYDLIDTGRGVFGDLFQPENVGKREIINTIDGPLRLITFSVLQKIHRDGASRDAQIGFLNGVLLMNRFLNPQPKEPPIA